MHCQVVCPQNKKFLQLNEQSINFSEEETSIILQKTPQKNISPMLAKKFVDLNLDEYYSLLGRNLTVLMNK
jgi:epoxyqueuosine reductase